MKEIEKCMQNAMNILYSLFFSEVHGDTVLV